MKRVMVALTAVLIAGLSITAAGRTTSRPQLRIGFVIYGQVVATTHTIEGEMYVGFLRAERKLGIHGRVVYVAPTQDASAALTSLARQRFDLVINAVFDAQPVGEVARRFPRVKFLLPDAPMEVLPGRPKNVEGTVYRSAEAGYLAGYLASLMEDRRRGKHVVSAVGGVPTPGVARWIVGYKAGARMADPRIVVRIDYAQDFIDVAKCRRTALSQIAAGSGVVFNVAGACGLGALSAAKEKGAWGIGVDVDQSFLGRHILTSAVNNLDKGVFDSIRMLADRRFGGGSDVIFDLHNGGVALGRISPQVPRDILRRVESVRKAIIAGKIKVPGAT